MTLIKNIIIGIICICCIGYFVNQIIDRGKDKFDDMKKHDEEQFGFGV